MNSIYILQNGEDFALPEHLCWPITSFDPSQSEARRYFSYTADAAIADYLYLPLYLTPLIQQMGIAATRELLRIILPDFARNEARFLFFNYEDISEPLGIASNIFQISFNRQRHDSNAIAYPYPVKDPLDGDDLMLDEVYYHTSFVGYVGSHPIRERIADLLSRVATLQMYVETVPLFHGHQDVEEQRSRQELYRKIMRQSLTVLCPRGAGENSVRFFETMAMGRIPVLIADNAALPMEAVIPYDEFVIRVPENEIDGIAEHILRWLSRRTNDQINDACLKARHSWHSWLRIEQVPALVAYELSRRNPGLNSGERVL